MRRAAAAWRSQTGAYFARAAANSTEKQVDNDSDRWQSSPRLGAAITVNVNYHRFCGFLRGTLPRFRQVLSLCLLALMTLPRSSSAQWNPLNPVRSSQKGTSGLTIFLAKGALRFKVCSYLMICVLYSPGQEFPGVADDVAIKSDWPSSPFDVTENAAEIALTYDGRGVEIKRDLGERLAPGAESGAPVHYALQSQAMRSNLSRHNSGGPIE